MYNVKYWTSWILVNCRKKNLNHSYTSFYASLSDQISWITQTLTTDFCKTYIDYYQLDMYLQNRCYVEANVWSLYGVPTVEQSVTNATIVHA